MLSVNQSLLRQLFLIELQIPVTTGNEQMLGWLQPSGAALLSF